MYPLLRLSKTLTNPIRLSSRKCSTRFEPINPAPPVINKLTFLSKKGELSILFEDFKNINGEEKREIGKQLNILRQEIELIFNENRENFSGGGDSHRRHVHRRSGADCRSHGLRRIENGAAPGGHLLRYLRHCS